MGAVLLVGCGRLGSAIVEGWLVTNAVPGDRLMILNPSRRPVMDRAAEAGADIRPASDSLARADQVVLAVKPAVWRDAVAAIASHLSPDAVILSVMAGVRAADISAAMAGRTVVRVMPTTGVAAARGAAAIWSAAKPGLDAARRLFQPIATVVELETEDQLDAATAISGSGQAYFFALVVALARAGAAQGLDPAAAQALARATLSSAAAGAQAADLSPADLIAQVASPGGTTRAALDVFEREGALDRLVDDAVAAAVRRAGDLARS